MNNLEHINLDELQVMSKGDPRFVIKMLQVCHDNAPGLLEKLSEAIRQKNAAAITAAAHRLRPTFHYLGRADIGALLQEMEEHNAELSAAGLEQKLEEVLQQAALVNQDVKIALSQLKADEAGNHHH